MSVSFKVEEREDFTIVNIELPGPIEPSILKTITPPKVDTRKGVIISGRAPIWLYLWLAHKLHATRWIATYDPRLGAVIVASHVLGVEDGTVIDIKLE